MTDELIPALPEENLRWRVAGVEDADWFWRSGQMSVDCISTMLSIAKTSFVDYSRALEFGCGSGRILLHMKEIGEQIELYGCDIDPESIGWATANVPWVTFAVNDGLPPLDYPDHHFDLVFNQSVFTHLNEDYQDAWLSELQRIVKPGGMLVLSVSGHHPFFSLMETWRDANVDTTEIEEAYRTKGIIFIEDDMWINGPFPDFYHSTFHNPAYIFDHWSKFFEIKAYVPRGSLDFQDYLLLQRR